MGWTPCMVKDESRPEGAQYVCPHEERTCDWCEWYYNERKALEREMEG